MTEAYSVLSDVAKRRQYDRLIAEHRQRSAPARPPSPPKDAATPPPRSHTSPPAGPGPQAQAGKGGYWEPLKRWPGKHPEIVVLVGLVTLMFVVVVFSDSNTPASPRSNATLTIANAPGPAISYSAFPCDARYSVSPIDGKPCPRLLDSMASRSQVGDTASLDDIATPSFEIVDPKPLAKKSTAPIAPRAKRTPAPEGEQVASCAGNLHEEPGGVFVTGNVMKDETVEVLERRGNSAKIKNNGGEIGWLECREKRNALF
jgi:hypothetical protein